MGVPNQFNDIIQQKLGVFAAWLPVVNKYTLGDYGIFADGVFSKLGNIADDFGVTINEGTGTAASIDFASDGDREIKLSGDADVSATPAGQAKASIQIEFKNAKSFLVKSPVITVANINNVNEVAKKLKASGNWDGQWKVVHEVYNAQDAVIVITNEAGTKLSFTGDASALGQMNLGSAGVNLDTNKTLGLKINGKDGVIGLGLFRIKSKIFGGMKVKILADEAADEDIEESIEMLDPKNGQPKDDL